MIICLTFPCKAVIKLLSKEMEENVSFYIALLSGI